MRFRCIGYGVRRVGPRTRFSADMSAWPLHAAAKAEIEARGLVRENFYQLLDIATDAQLRDVTDIVARHGDAVLIGLSVQQGVIEACETSWGWPRPAALSQHGYVVLGYDVCDIGGLFSIVFMEHPHIARRAIFGPGEAARATAFTQVASIALPEHRPCAAVELACAAEFVDRLPPDGLRDA